MYDLIETRRGAPRTTSYVTLHEGIEELTRRAGTFVRRPGARVLTQRPLRFVAIAGDGEQVTLRLLRRSAHHAG